jgi:outer membrane protein insertion porin family
MAGTRGAKMAVRRIWLVPFFFLVMAGVCFGQEEKISKITILGNVKIEEGVIRGAVKSREGGRFSTEQVREDLRSLFALGYFTDVQVDIKPGPEGREVIFIVVEKPSIRDVQITGNDKVKLDDIKEKMTLSPRTVLNLDKVKEASEQIRKLYFSKGYYGVTVEYKIDYLENNEAAVSFKIKEGPKGRIKDVVFKGNEHLKSSDLKRAMLTRKWTLLSILTKTGILDEDVLKNDTQLLTAYYFDHGFLDAKISEPKIDLQDPKRIRIEFNITEGPQYHIGTIDFKGDVLTTKEDLFKVVKAKRNDVYSNTAVRKDITALTEKFANQGYAYVEISPETAVDSKALLVNVTFDIEKKRRVSFEKIQITGNMKSRDKIVRREIQVAEGELYNATALNKSRDRLKRTGYFKEVEFSTSRGTQEDKVNLDVKVEETPTGSISFGLGYSTIESIVGSASISDRNLFGLGYQGGLKVSLGSVTRSFRLGVTDPYFLGYPYSAGFDIYHDYVAIFDTYKYKILGGDIRFGKELSDNFRIDAMYKLENINVYDVTPDASIYIKEQIGKKTTSAISVTPSYDARNDFFNPTKGSRHSIFLQNAGGVLGGDNYFVKILAETSWFFPMPLNTVLNLRGKAGFIQSYGGTQTPIYERFFVGGLYTIRGYEYGKAGPVDAKTGDPLGAENMLIFNTELIFPLSREIGLKGAVFVDLGTAWGAPNAPGVITNSGLKAGFGAGIRWFSPFGPIHIDLGINPNPQHNEKRTVFEFTAGSVY